MSKYSQYTSEQLEELFSNYLIDSWSYSKVGSFARNEKEFEKTHIYREASRKSASTVAGNAYHHALELFFNNLKDRVETSLIELEQAAFGYIDFRVAANDWKLQKTTPTVEECIIAANKAVTQLLNNFITESSVYLSEIEEVLDVEVKCNEWLTINGVDIPLPCHGIIDLVVRLKDGKIAVIDHKSRTSFTDEKELSFTSGKQAITYVKCYESKIEGVSIDEVWFVENKISKNRDSSPQLLKHKILIDKDTRALYEAMLYEPLRRMIEAVSDPDYVYMINDSDNFIDRAELYEFWAKTMIAEVDDFNIPEGKKGLIAARQKKIRDASIASVSPRVISSFRDNAASFIVYDLSNKNMNNSEKIEHMLRTFGMIVKVTHEIKGYSSNTYLLEVSAGIKIANVVKYKLDIANALNVSNVRIGSNLMVYEGKSYLYIEVQKKRTEDLLFDAKYLKGLHIPIGIDNFQQTVIWDMDNHSTPHVLICGATGSGKSVSIASTIEYAKLAGIKDIIIFDPKYEFIHYKSDKNTRVYNEIEEIEKEMKNLVDMMQERVKTGEKSKVLVIFDEFADAVAASRSGVELDIREEVQVGNYAPKKISNGFGGFMMSESAPKMEIKVTGRLKSLEENLKILLQKGRSLGFRIIAATQRASVNVITGDAKVNFPVQICFRVPKEIDSKVVLDEAGAETLGGMGDGLIKSPEYMSIVRFQGFYKN
jgi:DNA segregation ATPase FtsK/SpoIIIE and related proteins